MLAHEDYDSEADSGLERPAALPGPRRSLVATAALLATSAVLAFVASSTGSPSPVTLRPRVKGSPVLGLNEMDEDPCDKMPYVRIMSIKSNNLGGKGPDKGVPEGLIYNAVAHHAGLNGSNVEIHLHATTEYSFDNGEVATNVTVEYHPEWPKVNGITGHFGTINVHPGTNVTMVLKGYDPATGKDIKLPEWAMTFFDLDTGKDYHSVEFLKINNFKEYYVSNETELEVRRSEDGSTIFKGTVEGDGDDNPDNPLKLTVRQKNRAVSFVFQDTHEVVFELGSSPGDTARVFQFVVRPILRCAYTKLADGTLMAHDDPNSPIVPVRGAGERSRPAALVVGLALLAAQRWL